MLPFFDEGCLSGLTVTSVVAVKSIQELRNVLTVEPVCNH